MNPSSLAGHVVELLELADRQAVPPDTIVSDFFRFRKYLGSHDRRYISSAFYTILRHRRYLDTLLDRFLTLPGHQDLIPSIQFRYLPLLAAALHAIEKRPLEEIQQAVGSRWKTVILRVPVEELFSFLDSNAGLGFLNHSPLVKLATQYSFQDWMVERLSKQYGDSLEPLLAKLNEPAHTTLRVNSLRSTREACRERLAEEGIESTPSPLSPVGLVVGKRFNKNNLNSFRDGWFEVQDEGSQLVSLMLPAKPGMTVVDACAGAGGKTLHLAEMMQDEGEIIAFDIDPRRLEELRKRSERAGLRSVRIHPEGTYQPENFYRKADLVIVDAPCSGSGTIRRNPGMKWSVTGSLVGRFNELQDQILRNAALYVKPGGVLAYVTCSLFAEENEQIVQRFLQGTGGFSVVPPELQVEGAVTHPDGSTSLLPHKTDTDGFYIAVMKQE